MTFEQAQLYIRLFILQHYDKKLSDIVPDPYYDANVSSLYEKPDHNWAIKLDTKFSRIIIWASKRHFEEFDKPVIGMVGGQGKDFNIQDYVNLKEEKI